MRGSPRRALLLATTAAAFAACEAFFPLEGFDTPPGGGGSPADGGTGGAVVDAGGDALDDAAPDVVEDVEGDTGPADAPPDGPPPNPCAGKTNGTQWDTSDYFARCCGGQPTHTDTDPNNCAVCGLKCINSQTCGLENAAMFPHAVYCIGCLTNACSGALHCVPTVEKTKGACVPDDGMGNCVDSSCSSGKCQNEGMYVNDYCYY
jgi:hypothetical protein